MSGNVCLSASILTTFTLPLQDLLWQSSGHASVHVVPAPKSFASCLFQLLDRIHKLVIPFVHSAHDTEGSFSLLLLVMVK